MSFGEWGEIARLIKIDLPIKRISLKRIWGFKEFHFPFDLKEG
jgi:hypothetical protein